MEWELQLVLHFVDWMNHCAVARNASLTKARPLWRRCVLSSTRQKNSQRPSRSRWSERSRARDQGLISGGEEIIYEEMLKGWRLLVSMYGNGVLCGDICPRMMLIRYHIIERDRHQRSGRQSDDQSARQKLSLGGALGRPFPERKLCAVRPYLLKVMFNRHHDIERERQRERPAFGQALRWPVRPTEPPPPAAEGRGGGGGISRRVVKRLASEGNGADSRRAKRRRKAQ